MDTTIYSFDRKHQFVGQILNSKQIGTWKELDSIGTLVRTIEIIGSKGESKIIPNFEDSLLSGYFHGYFIQNKVILHGEFQLNNLTELTKTEGNYFFGRLNGQKRYYKEGNLKCFDYYSVDSLKYLSIPFKKNGDLMNISSMNNKGYQSGVFVDFDDSSHVTTVGYFDDGCKVGEWLYFKNQKLYSKGNYYTDYIKLKIINDTFYLVNKNDSLASEIYPDEVIKSFDIKDQILYLKHGKWYYFDSEGYIIRIVKYYKGQIILNKKRKK